MRIEELVCDGVILSTAAGSTGYNYSASGPIIPLGSNVVALTAVSAYSPRHWRGGLLKDNAKIKIINNNPSKRPIVVHADHIDISNFSESLNRKIISINKNFINLHYSYQYLSKFNLKSFMNNLEKLLDI